MKVKVYENEKDMALKAAEICSDIIKKAQKKNPNKIARILLSTGASQLPFFEEFIKADIDWSNVEMFHLDEYVGVDDKHIASFKKYLNEKFVSIVKPRKANLIDGMKNPEDTIKFLTLEILKRPIDLGLIGIGENAHIAFNDPPADFDDDNAYKIVTLSDTCKQQQVREKWFASEDEVCKQAISMTCRQILKCKEIICVVPYRVKAKAIYDTLTQDINNLTPATLLKTHCSCLIMVDKESASMLNDKILKEYK